MGEKIRLFTAKELEKLLALFGFQLVSQKGSHRKWRNFDSGKQVMVPFPRSKPLPIGTLRNLLISAEIPESEWKA